MLSPRDPRTQGQINCNVRDSFPGEVALELVLEGQEECSEQTPEAHFSLLSEHERGLGFGRSGILGWS